ncbi:uncharacterized protein LOC111072236 [Drosophila obscura]|uniref:uncharacterized protein LOC111072236 n=1 Tax=Drosophila obscura TaxID=7282 RepID=UPI001BB1AFE3|nr:uncharacterized protein LOC111072236 [Drosophila obscura]
MFVSAPPYDAHWNVEFKDVLKPFPNGKLANATFKIMRFLYPPYAVGVMDVIPVVDDPQPNFAAISLVLGTALVLGFLCYAAYRRKFLVKHSPASEAPSKRQKGFWDRYGIPDGHCESEEDTEEENGITSEEEQSRRSSNSGLSMPTPQN